MAGVNGCKAVYPEVTHLLCKWHVDRLVTAKSSNCNGLIYSLTTRAWQRKLHALVKDPEQKANIYACLWIMINEQDVDKFKENESTFIDYWSSRQKKFIEYYQSEYKTKAGKLTHAS